MSDKEAFYDFLTGCVVALVALVAMAGTYHFLRLDLELRSEKMKQEFTIESLKFKILMEQIVLAKRVQEILARENTIGTLEEALYQLNLENKLRRKLAEQLFTEQLIREWTERKLKKFQGESVE
jgi:hypothetical protein